MSTDYSKMSDFEINCMIAKILHTNFVQGAFPFINDGSVRLYGCDRCFDFNPCNNPADAWPIIVDNKISIVSLDNKWLAAPTETVIDGVTGDSEVCFYASSDAVFDVNPLRAAMIAFLMMQESKNAS